MISIDFGFYKIKVCLYVGILLQNLFLFMMKVCENLPKRKVDSVALKVISSLLLHRKYIVVQKGKKNYFLIISR